MRVVCAPNAFKGTLTAAAASRALAAGLADVGADPVVLPVADGGDGTLEVLLAGSPRTSRLEWHVVTGPLGRPRRARLGWLSSDTTVVEMAEASGLRLLPADRRDPLGATSRGAGELIAAALDGGARRIVVGVGGSASTDGGTGVLRALGVRFLDARGGDVPWGGAGLAAIDAVEVGGLDPRLAGCRLEVAVDVRSPLNGTAGAARVFAPQKGASPAQVDLLDAGLRRLAAVLEPAVGMPGLSAVPGAGAAGGTGFALAAIGALIRSGAELVCDQLQLDAALTGASLAITGEGRLDGQTATGKAPAEVARRARGLGVPCVAVAGLITGGQELFDATIALSELGPDPRRHARRLLREAGRRAPALAAESAQR